MYDVIIIGSGPAGLTAAIYTTRANLKTLIIAGYTWGGQLMLTSVVENFPGFPEGIMGPDLMTNMRKQAEKHGAEIIDENFKYGDYVKKPIEIVTDTEKKFLTKSVIIATGAETNWLGVPGEKEKIGRGVSSCAPCDAAFYKDKNVIVAGGGDSAMEEALYLTKFAKHVWVIHRRDSLRASKIMQDKAFSNEKISFIFNTEIAEILGEMKVEGVKLRSKMNPFGKLRAGDQRSRPKADQPLAEKVQVRIQNSDIEQTPEQIGGKVIESGVKSLESSDKTLATSDLFWSFPIDGVFVAIGHRPNSAVFEGIEKDEKGFIKVFDHTKTNIEGVFVAGDVHDSHYQQAITAAGFGCMAALDIEKWLMKTSR